MAEDIIYGPQNFTAADFTTSGLTSDVYRSSTWSGLGGPHAPLTGYPEMVRMERVERVESAGPAGEHVCEVRTVDGPPYSFDSTVAEHLYAGYGPLANGQYDCRGPIHARYWQKLVGNVIEDIQFAACFYLIHHANTGGVPDFTVGPTGTGAFICGVEMNGTGGTSFEWLLRYYRHNGTIFSNTQVIGSSDVADDRWVEIELILTPATVTGAYNGTGGTGSSSVASDGSVVVKVDGTEVASVSSAKVVVNKLAISNPEVYYGYGHRHGDI